MLYQDDLILCNTCSMTDPFIVIYQMDRTRTNMVKIGTTEVIKDNLNPSFTTSIVMDYMFEMIQDCVVRLYHCNPSRGGTDRETNHELIGEARFEVGRLMRSPSQKMSLLLQGANAGYVLMLLIVCCVDVH
jgi:hypothetical protein